MSNIDFDNGFLLGLAVVYKKAAVAKGFGDFLVLTLADGILQSPHIITARAAVKIVQPEDVRPVTVDSVDITAMTVTDAVQTIL